MHVYLRKQCKYGLKLNHLFKQNSMNKMTHLSKTESMAYWNIFA